MSICDELWHQIDYRTIELRERFNVGTACVDAQDPSAPARTVVAPNDSHRDYTFDVRTRRTGWPNVLAGLGIRRGDVVALVNAGDWPAP